VQPATTALVDGGSIMLVVVLAALSGQWGFLLQKAT
jgi:hypothetical protein